MTQVIEMVVPPTGESIDSARLVRWAVEPGQAFRTGDLLLEIETDKSVIEVPAHEDGVMIEHLVQADGLLNTDTPIARIEVEDDRASAKDLPKGSQLPVATQARDVAAPSDKSPARDAAPDARSPGADKPSRKFATPAARSLAAERGVAIEPIEGTGPGARVTRFDVARALPPLGSPSAQVGAKSEAPRAGGRESMVATAHGDIFVNVWEPASSKRGATAVVVHGLFGDSNTWAGLAHAMNRAGWRVVAMDLPCHGKSRSGTTDFAQVVDAVADVIARQCSGAVALVGHSFGAAVAARVAHKPDVDIESLVLIAPVGLGTEIEQSFIDGMTFAGTIAAVQRELSKLTVAGITPSAAYIDELRAHIQARREPLTRFCREASWNGVQQINIAPDLAGLQFPVAVIQGRQDKIIPWQHALNVPARVALHLLPDAGHMPQWEATTLVTEIILDTVSR